jgi:pimeloyl-ACP methyl ester carboxylesterase
LASKNMNGLRTGRDGLALEAIELNGAGVSVTAIASFTGRIDTPLLLLVHGGGANAHYFATPDNSVIDLAAANGFASVAINRPGYADSGELADGIEGFSRQAEVIDLAMGELWQTRGEGRPGVVVLAHSIGAAITVHLAARHPSWPLLGISITGITATPPPFLVDLWRSMPPGERIEFSPELHHTIHRSEPGWEAEADATATWREPTPTAELLEIATRWPEEVADIAAEVAVPVQYAVGEHEKLWVVGETTPADCARLFANAPYVDAHLLPGVGHTVEHEGTLGRSHQLRQLSFALRCTGPSKPGGRLRRRSARSPT